MDDVGAKGAHEVVRGCTIATHKAAFARGLSTCPECGGRIAISLPDRMLTREIGCIHNRSRTEVWMCGACGFRHVEDLRRSPHG